VNAERKLERTGVSVEIAQLATDRLLFWSQLREMAGLKLGENARNDITSALQADFEVQLSALRAEYEAKIVDLKTRYPRAIARRIAEGLLGAGNRNQTVAELLERAQSNPYLEPFGFEPVPGPANGAPSVSVAPNPSIVAAPSAAVTAPAAADAGAVAVVAADDELGLEPYIDTSRCTSCNECTNINSRLFAYDASKQAYIKDAKAGTFAQLVMAAEKCPAGLIHPGTPLNPNEKDLAKWIKRAEPFN
jgi:ferredoxin